MRFRLCLLIVCPLVLSGVVSCKTAFEEFARGVEGGAAGSGQPTREEVAVALSQALMQGVDLSISALGKQDGFNANSRVRIPLPEDLEKPAHWLREAGQKHHVDQFVTTMNRAAEQAVGKARPVFADAVRAMTIDDAVAIVRGPRDAATEYFRRTSSDRLKAEFRPIVGRATDSVQLTQTYKTMLDRAGPLAGFVSPEARDLDGYITSLAIDGLFQYIADEERRIRERPVSRTTELLKKVFSYYGQ